jgi:hypothetical protein
VKKFWAVVLGHTSLPASRGRARAPARGIALGAGRGPTPNGDWSNPDTFSSGQQVAHFMRPESLFLQVLQTDSASPPPFESVSQHALTETLVSSQSFTFGRSAPRPAHRPGLVSRSARGTKGHRLLAIGLLTRPVAALFCGFMAVAAFHVHLKVG